VDASRIVAEENMMVISLLPEGNREKLHAFFAHHIQDSYEGLISESQKSPFFSSAFRSE